MSATQGDSHNPGVFTPTASTPESTLSNEGQGRSEHATSSLAGVGADLPTGQSEQRRSNTGALLLVLVVVIAAATLYAMRRFGLGGELNLLELKIDYPVEQRENFAVENESQERILEQLQQGVETVQIPLKEVKKNPFEFTFLTPQPAAEPEPVQRVSDEERRRRERERRIEQTLEQLELDSIVGGPVPMARISGELVRQGDTVAELFTVRRIMGRSVELEVDGEIHVLAMGQR